MNQDQVSVIANRMQTVVDLYDRSSGYANVASKTGLTVSNVGKILRANNYYHGIERHEGTKKHPINAIIDYKKFAFLLNNDKIDALRERK